MIAAGSAQVSGGSASRSRAFARVAGDGAGPAPGSRFAVRRVRVSARAGVFRAWRGARTDPSRAGAADRRIRLEAAWGLALRREACRMGAGNASRVLAKDRRAPRGRHELEGCGLPCGDGGEVSVRRGRNRPGGIARFEKFTILYPAPARRTGCRERAPGPCDHFRSPDGPTSGGCMATKKKAAKKAKKAAPKKKAAKKK